MKWYIVELNGKFFLATSQEIADRNKNTFKYGIVRAGFEADNFLEAVKKMKEWESNMKSSQL